MGLRFSRQRNTDCSDMRTSLQTGYPMGERRSLSREEQYAWFKFLRDSSDDEVIQYMKDNIHMVSTAMHFKIYSRDTPELKLCSCAFDLEQGHSSSESTISALKLLEYCIQFGECPHYILDGCGYDDILKQTICVEDIYKQDVIDKEGSHSRRTRSAGLYWIHLLLILGRARIVIEVLNHSSLCKTILYALSTCIHKFSPLHLALIHDLDRDLGKLLPHFRNVFDEGYISYNHKGNNFGDLVSILEITIDREKIKTLKYLTSSWGITSTKALQYAANSRKFESMAILKDKGFSMSGSTFYKLARNCIEDGDMEWLSALLDLKEVAKKQECTLLQTAVKFGCKDSVSLILNKLFNRKTIKKTRKSFQIRCFIVSILLHDAEKFKILMNFGMDYNSLCYDHSSSWWAETFGQNEISKLLKEKGAISFPVGAKRDDTYESLFCENVNVLSNTKYLFESGWDINGIGKEGIPLCNALKCRNEELIRYLIEKGANIDGILKYPECLSYLKHPECESSFNLKRLFCIFIDFNVNLSFNGTNSFVRLFSDFPKYLEFVLFSAHTIKTTDKQFLIDKFLCTETSHVESRKCVEKLLFSPKQLTVLCRDSLRRHYGRKFPKFITYFKQYIPYVLLKILQCEVIQEIFIETAEDNLNHRWSS